MNNDLLDQLRPIRLPDYNVGLWPLAPGWWILIALASLIIVGFLFLLPLLKSRWQKQQLQKNTLELLNALYISCKKERDTSLSLQAYLQKSNDIFKRVIHANPRLSRFSHLAGNDWVAFISSVDPKTPFAKLYGDNLYGPRCKDKINLDNLHRWAAEWVVLVTKKPPQEISK